MPAKSGTQISLENGNGMRKLNSPIAFFIFRRPEPTARVFEQIRRHKPSRLFLIADGQHEDKQESDLISQTRALVEKIDWPCEVTRIYSDTNLGLRQRILSGLDEVFARVDRAIILEDDCLPNSSFFKFCEEMLARYENVKTVALVSGSNFAPYKSGEPDYFFSHSTFIWGWATWASRWQAFRSSPQVESWTTAEINEIGSTFSSWSHKREFVRLMKVAHKLNTWDVSLAVWVRQKRLLTVVPRLNLVQNIGFGNDATHTKFEAFDVVPKSAEFNVSLHHPRVLEIDPRREKRMWKVKLIRWIQYPIFHPFEFFRRSLRFLSSRKE
jgi:hypothetical protein